MYFQSDLTERLQNMAKNDTHPERLEKRWIQGGVGHWGDRPPPPPPPP